MVRGVLTALFLMLSGGACASAGPTLDDVLRDSPEAWPAAETTEVVEADPVERPAPVVDPFEVPARIDATYVELVVDELLRVLSDALRAHLADEHPGALRTESVFREVYGLGQLDRRLDDLRQVFSTEAGRETQYPPEQFGVQHFEVLELLRVGEGCVTVLGHYDVTQTSRFPYRDQPMVFVIHHDERYRTPTNRTSWRLWDAARAVTAEDTPLPLDQLDALVDLDVLVDADCSTGTTGRDRS